MEVSNRSERILCPHCGCEINVPVVIEYKTNAKEATEK